MSLRTNEFRAFAMTAFAQGYGTRTSIDWPNSKFRQPKNEPWAVFRIVAGDGFPINIGRVKYQRHAGILQVDVLVPEDSDTATGNDIADLVAAIFNDRDELIEAGHRVRFKPATVREMGCADGQYRIMVRCPYERDVRL